MSAYNLCIFKGLSHQKAEKYGIYVNFSHLAEKKGDFKTLRSVHGTFLKNPITSLMLTGTRVCIHPDMLQNSIKKKTKTKTNQPKKEEKEKKSLVHYGWLFKGGPERHQYWLSLFETKTSSSKTLKLRTKPTLSLMKIRYYIKSFRKIFVIPASSQQE